MVRIIDRKRYDTSTATLISGNDYWDGNNWERQGRNTFLYKTPKGAFFAVHLTQWQGENNSIEPLTEGEAVDMYESHAASAVCRVSYDEAFPNIRVEDA